MNAKQFLNSLANGESDIVRTLLDILEREGARYCLNGGLAVNAYADPSGGVIHTRAGINHFRVKRS